MNAGREHRVPLSGQALAGLRRLQPRRDPDAGDWVFSGARKGRPLSNMSMETLLRRMKSSDLTRFILRHGKEAADRHQKAPGRARFPPNPEREVTDWIELITVPNTLRQSIFCLRTIDARPRMAREYESFGD
jgi:integrase